MQNFRFSIAELVVRLKRKGGKHEVQKLMNVLFDVFIDAKQLRRQVKKVEDCKCIVTESTHDAMSMEEFQGEKLRRADKSPNARAILYRRNILIFHWSRCNQPHPILFLEPKDVLAGMVHPITTQYSKTIRRKVREMALELKKMKFCGTLMTTRY